MLPENSNFPINYVYNLNSEIYNVEITVLKTVDAYSVIFIVLRDEISELNSNSAKECISLPEKVSIHRVFPQPYELSTADCVIHRLLSN